MSKRTLADYEFRPEGMFFEGKRAGGIGPDGYRRVYVDGKRYKEHRLLWTHYNGDIPLSKEIHHIDGDKLNNALSNLMCLTHQEHIALDQRHADPVFREKMRRAVTGIQRSPETRAKLCAAKMGRQCGSGAHPRKYSNNCWAAEFWYLKRLFNLGCSPTEAEAQVVLDGGRHFANTKPLLAEFAAWAKR